MRRPLRTLLSTALVLVALPVAADAPNGSDPKRAAQYDPFDRNSTVIHDAFTNLTWERFVPKIARTFDVAEAGCASSFSGRMPTVKELLTLVDEEPHLEYDSSLGKNVEVAIDRYAFGNGTGGPKTFTDAAYWSSTPTGEPDEVWGVSFADGTMVRLKTSVQAYARCVR